MTEDEAESLAQTIRAVTSDDVAVEEVDGGMVVEVRTARGSYTLWDEVDWQWLRPRILGGEPTN